MKNEIFFLLFLTTTCAFNKEMWSFIPRCAQNKKCLQVDIDIDMISVDLIAHCTSDKLVYLIFIEYVVYLKSSFFHKLSEWGLMYKI